MQKIVFSAILLLNVFNCTAMVQLKKPDYTSQLESLRCCIKTGNKQNFEYYAKYLAEIPLKELEGLQNLITMRSKIFKKFVEKEITTPVLNEMLDLTQKMDIAQTQVYEPGTPPNWAKFLREESTKEMSPSRRTAINIFYKEIPYGSIPYTAFMDASRLAKSNSDTVWPDIFGIELLYISSMEKTIKDEIDKYEKIRFTRGEMCGYIVKKKA